MIGVLRKDAIQHGWLLVPATGLAAALALVRLGAAAASPQRDPLEAFREVVLLLFAPLTWLLVDRLVTREYRQRGWDALAPFPVRPAGVIAVEAGGVAALLVALTGGAWLAAVTLTLTFGSAALGSGEPVAVRALQGSGGFLAVWTGYLLLAATLGRHRLLLHAAALSALALEAPLAATPGLGWAVDAQAAGAARLEQAAGTAAALAAVALALAAARARAWQGRTSLASRWALAVAAAAAAVASGALDAPAAFRLEGAAARRPGAPLAVALQGSVGEVEAEAALAAVGPALQTLERRLGVTLPEAVLVPDAGLDGRSFPPLEAAGGGAVPAAVRANPAASDWAPVRCRARLAFLALDEATGGRLAFGGWRLVLEGLPQHVALSAPLPEADAAALTATAALFERRAAWGLVALERAGLPLGAGTLRRWDRVRGEVGGPVAAALAGWLLRTLGDELGEEVPWALGREAWRRRRGWGGGFGLSAGAWAAALEAATGLTPDPLARRLAGPAAALRARHRDLLAALPALPTGEVGLSGSLTEGGAGAGGEGAAGRALWFRLGGGGRAAVWHGLAGLDGGPPEAPWREEAPADGRRRVSARHYRHGPVLAARARYAPALDCAILRGWRAARAAAPAPGRRDP